MLKCYKVVTCYSLKSDGVCRPHPKICDGAFGFDQYAYKALIKYQTWDRQIQHTVKVLRWIFLRKKINILIIPLTVLLLISSSLDVYLTESSGFMSDWESSFYKQNKR